MAKPRDIIFGETFERLLIDAWGTSDRALEGKLLERTQKAIKEIRAIYRLKGETPSKIRYSSNKNLVGYLGAFGEKHAYLTYLHLKEIKHKNPNAVPNPRPDGSLNVTLVGAGAALEIYGLCLYYNEKTQRVKKLKVNVIEREANWRRARLSTFGVLLKDIFPKIKVDPVELDVDLTRDCISKFAMHHDRLIDTDIMIVYNVLNEIPSTSANKVLRNLNYILRQIENPMLVLVMEPSAKKIAPREDWFTKQIALLGRVIIRKKPGTYYFNKEPCIISLGEDERHLNNRLFRRRFSENPPEFSAVIQRTSLAAVINPGRPLSRDEAISQLVRVPKRTTEGIFLPTPKGITKGQEKFDFGNE